MAPPPVASCTRRLTWSDELPSTVWMRAVRQDALDDPDVLVPDDQVAGLRRPGRGRHAPCRRAAPTRRRRRRGRSPGPGRRAGRRPRGRPRRRSTRTTGRRRSRRWPGGTARSAGESLEPGGCSADADLGAGEVERAWPAGVPPGARPPARRRAARAPRGCSEAATCAGWSAPLSRTDAGGGRRAGRAAGSAACSSAMRASDVGKGHRPRRSAATRARPLTRRAARRPPRSDPFLGRGNVLPRCPTAGAKERSAGPGWPARACSCRPAAGCRAS